MKSTEYIIMVIMGGMGSLSGSVVAAIVLSVIPEMLRAFSEYRMLVYSVLLILMMIFRPTGLFGRREFSLYDAIRALPRQMRRFLAWLKHPRLKKKEREEGEING